MTHACRVVILAGCIFSLAGCGLAVLGGGAAAVTAMEDRRTSGTMFDDDGIERSVNRGVRARFGDATHVNVTSFSRVVLLTGEVPDEATRTQVEKIAHSIANVRAVTNELQIGSVSSMASRANDSLITAKIKARLVDSGKVNPVHVKVVTEAGVVYLLGLVTEAEANEAVEIARTTGGVRKVVKVFEYCSAEDSLCRPYAEKTRPPA